MTQAICLHCGEIGFGAMTPCKSCGYRPNSSYEIGYAIVESDHHRTLDVLLKRSDHYKKRFQENNPAYTRHGDEEERIILKYFDACDGRDVFILKRFAKNSLFRKQINFHFTGPDGYENKVIERKRDISKKQFDAMRSICEMDVFFINSYLDGKAQSAQVSKNIWYAVHDHMTLLDTFHSSTDSIIRALAAQGMEMTNKYLLKNGFDIN